jgi:hypothetical protein
MPKEYIITVETDKDRMEELAQKVRERKDTDPGNLDSREKVLLAIVHSVKKNVRHLSYKLFAGQGTIAFLDIPEEDVDAVEKCLDHLQPFLVNKQKTMTEKKLEKKIEKGKMPEWWGEALFNKHKMGKTPSTSKWIYRKFFRKLVGKNGK